MPAPSLEIVTPDNVEAACALRLLPHQEVHVEPVAESLALAYTLPAVAWPRLIYDGSTLVGFVMAFHDVAWTGDPRGTVRSGLWRLNIDADHQHRGYGRFAVEAVCHDLATRGVRACVVTYDPGADGPESFYLGLGFRPTGELSGHQVVAQRQIRPTAEGSRERADEVDPRPPTPTPETGFPAIPGPGDPGSVRP